MQIFVYFSLCRNPFRLLQPHGLLSRLLLLRKHNPAPLLPPKGWKIFSPLETIPPRPHATPHPAPRGTLLPLPTRPLLHRTPSSPSSSQSSPPHPANVTPSPPPNPAPSPRNVRLGLIPPAGGWRGKRRKWRPKKPTGLLFWRIFERFRLLVLYDASNSDDDVDDDVDDDAQHDQFDDVATIKTTKNDATTG